VEEVVVVSDEARSVLRDIWHAREQSAADLDAALGHGRGKACKAMRHVGADPVDEDQRVAWWSRLEREDKLVAGGQSVGDLLAERADRRS
jgi:hypothetical protein